MTLRRVASTLLGLSSSFSLVNAKPNDDQVPLSRHRIACPDYASYASYPQYVDGYFY